MRQLFSALLLICLSVQVEAQSQTKILLEKLTATWCGWCPYMNETIDSLVMAHGEENVIVVQHHTGADPMATEFGMEVAESFINGSPALMFNRQKLESQWNVGVGRFDWAEVMTEVVNNTQDQVEIISTHSYDLDSRQLVLNIQVTPLVDLAGDYRVNCFIVEDDVHHPNDPFYYQVNYWGDVPDHPFSIYPNPIQDYKHRKVVRAQIGGPWGLNGSLPSTMSAGTLVETAFTYSIDPEIDENKLSYVVVVQKYSDDKFDRAILNAEEQFVEIQNEIVSGLESVSTPITVYPNPVQNELYIDSDEEIELLRLFNSQGRELKIEVTANGMDVQQLIPGWYIVQIKTNSGTEHHQFIRD